MQREMSSWHRCVQTTISNVLSILYYAIRPRTDLILLYVAKYLSLSTRVIVIAYTLKIVSDLWCGVGSCSMHNNTMVHCLFDPCSFVVSL